MGDKHLFKKKKNETPDTITPDSNVDTRPDTAVQGQNEPEQIEPEQKEFVYGMDQTEQGSEDVQSGTSDADGSAPSQETNENIIECDSLVKIYKTDDVEVMALQGLELNIKYGELMAVIGKSGSGKSTLLNMIGGLERPTAGKLYVDGKDLFAMTDKELVEYRKHTVGFVWQKNSRNLLPYMTAIENVQVPMYFDKSNKEDKYARAHDLLCRVGLEDKINSYPSQMSGGEQQRVAIARALITHPSVIFADEPTGNLDAASAETVAKMLTLAASKYQQTIVMVTHDRQMAEYADRILTITDGNVIGGVGV